MGLVSNEDLEYLSQQSKGNINMIVSGMTALMENNDELVEKMESQKWFKRMINTVFGKNKRMKNEIQKNHEKLNAYMSEAIGELYNKGCIQEEMIMNLGMQINELYADHIQLKAMLASFVYKLNEKIESVDNFHMLVKEIELGIYSQLPKIVSVCKILSLMDKRVVEDERKLGILQKSVEQYNIIDDEEMDLEDYLVDILNVDQDEIGLIYMKMQNLKGHYLADIILDVIESYFFLSDMNRQLVSKEQIVKDVMGMRKLKPGIKLSIDDIYEEFIDRSIDICNGLLPIADIQKDSKLKEAEELFLKCKYDDAYELFITLAEKGIGRAMYFLSEYYFYGYGRIMQNRQKSNEWAERGYENGDVLSELNVIYALDYEEDNEKDDKFNQVFIKVKALAEMGDLFAIYELADMYKSGRGVESDFDVFLEKIKYCVDNGYCKAMVSLGRYYYSNDNQKEAVRLFQKASDMGCGEATYQLGHSYVMVDDYDKAEEIYKKGIEQGSAECAFGMGRIYQRREFPKIESATKDIDKQIREFERAEEVNKEREKKMVAYFEQAAEMGVAMAAWHLAEHYEWGGIDMEEDKEKALKYYKLAADLGDEDSMEEYERLLNE